ncbi:MAG TPA: MerR family transcriptional regulator [Candidatus Thiothrix moscowensis]|nr:MAG: MerR family transcriptional regulator [Hydrogenophilales bacterium 16-62-9]HRJ95024.1 MerR family transcriptional regulator [Candidatus Thiothrix moscowensis]
MNEEVRHSIDDLCRLTGLTRRTVRFYVQKGLLDRPEGEKRGAWYTPHHVEQLLLIRKWTGAGLSLEAIRELLAGKNSNLPPVKPLLPGTVEVRSHLVVADGIEVVVSPERAHMSPEALRDFLRRVGEIYRVMQEENNDGQ